MANVWVETFVFMELRVKKEDSNTRKLSKVTLSAVPRNLYLNPDADEPVDKLVLRFGKKTDDFKNYKKIINFIERQTKTVCLISNLSDNVLSVGSISTVPQKNPDTLILVHQNIQGMSESKLDDIKQFLNDHKVDIFCVTEHHWLNDDQPPLFNFENYRLGSSYRRRGTTGGGSLIIIKSNNNIQFEERQDIVNLSVECTIEIACVELKDLVVVCVYRRKKYDDFERVMDKVLQKICIPNKQVILCGDFNVNLFNNSPMCFKIKNLFKSYNLHYLFLEPTRIAEAKAATCIDNIFTNILPESKHIIRELRSDHFGQLITILKGSKKVKKCIKTTNIKNCIYYWKTDSFKNKLRSQFPYMCTSYDPNKFYNSVFYMYCTEFISSEISGSLKDIETLNDKVIWNTKSIKQDPQCVETSSIHCFSIDSKIIKSDLDISTALEHFFADIPVLTTNCSNQSPDAEVLKHIKVCNNKLSFKPVCDKDIKETLNNLQDTMDSIPVVESFIKSNIDALVTLYNGCIERGTFPELMKWETEQSLFKTSSKSDPTPAVVLPLFIVFETIILSQLQSHFGENNLLQTMGQSTAKSSARLVIYNILDAWVKEHDALGIFWNFSKAENWVDLNTLDKKLRHYGIRSRARKLLISYNKNTEKLNVSGKTFDFILGSFLFRVYINDLAYLIKDNQEIVLYADEISILFKLQKRTQLSDEENTAPSTVLSNIVHWFNVNNFKLNIKNVKCIRFVSHLQIKSSVTINEKFVANARDIVKFLDITLDSKLQWNPHLIILSNKLNFAVCMISEIRQLATVDLDTVKKIYVNRFHKVMSYGILLWGHEAGDIERIYKLQKRAVKELNYLDQEQSSVAMNLKELNKLTVASQYIYENLIYVKQNIHLFRKRSDNHSINTRNKDKLVKPEGRIKKIEKTFMCQSVVFYNKLPPCIKKLDIEAFRRHVKKQLCTKCYHTVNDYVNDVNAWAE